MKISQEKKDFLYMIEYMFLPELFLQARSGDEHREFLSLFADSKTGHLVQVLDGSLYSIKDFHLDILNDVYFENKICQLVTLNCPDWDNNGLCKKIYIIYNENFEYPRYFTVEYSDYGEAHFMLCELDKDNQRHNYGKVDDDIQHWTNVIITKYLDELK